MITNFDIINEFNTLESITPCIQFTPPIITIFNDNLIYLNYTPTLNIYWNMRYCFISC